VARYPLTLNSQWRISRHHVTPKGCDHLDAASDEKPVRRSRPWADLDARLAELQQQPMLAVTGADLLAQERDRY